MLAVAIALGIGAAPVASDMCRVFCAAHAERSGTNAGLSHHHHAAGGAPVSTGATVRSGAHSCPELVSIVVQSRDTIRIATTLVLAAPNGQPLVLQTSVSIPIDTQHDPPGPARSTKLLRI
jgi:hypothetical protein